MRKALTERFVKSVAAGNRASPIFMYGEVIGFGVSDKAVQKAIASGRIAVEEDGTINPMQADRACGSSFDPAQMQPIGKTPQAGPAGGLFPCLRSGGPTTGSTTFRDSRSTEASDAASPEASSAVEPL